MNYVIIGNSCQSFRHCITAITLTGSVAPHDFKSNTGCGRLVDAHKNINTEVSVEVGKHYSRNKLTVITRREIVNILAVKVIVLTNVNNIELVTCKDAPSINCAKFYRNRLRGLDSVRG